MRSILSMAATGPNEYPEPDFIEVRIKHLEMVQVVIGRMSNASAWTKRMCLILVGAAVAVSSRVTGANSDVLIFAAGLTVVFWIIDSHYHIRELWFRDLYDEIRNETGRPDFRIVPNEESRTKHTVMKSLFGWSASFVYGPIFVFLLILKGMCL